MQDKCGQRSRFLSIAPFRTAVDQLAELPPSRTFWDVADVFRDFAQSTFVRELVARDLADLRADPSIARDAAESEIVLLGDDDFVVALRILGRVNLRHEGFLCGNPRHLVLCNPGTEAIVLSAYRESLGQEDGARPAHLQRLGEVRLEPGEPLTLPENEMLLDLTGAPPAPVLMLRSKPSRSTVWVYEKASLAPLYPAAIDAQVSRIELACEIVAQMNYTPAAAALEKLASDHAAHFLRWRALRALTQLDLTAGIRALEGAVDDPHSHVRRAAQKTLKNIRAAGLL